MSVYLGERVAFTLRIPPAVYARLKSRAKKQGVSVNDVVAHVLKEATVKKRMN